MTFTGTVSLQTKGFTDVVDITGKVAFVVQQSGVREGLVTVFCPGSTGAVTTIEFESGVIRDLQRVLEKMVPSNAAYEHDRRWADGNGFSHVRAALMKPSLSIPVLGGQLNLGTWQQIVFLDFDNRVRARNLTVQVIGDRDR